MAIDFLLRHVLHHRLEDKENFREVPGLHHDDTELDQVGVREDREQSLGQWRPELGLTAAHLDVVLASGVQHLLDLLVVVVVVVDPQQTL